MPARDLSKFQRKRLNPFKGLVIDVPIWSDAHNYHRDQQRLHALSSHQYGIVTGLEVVAWNPPGNSLVVYPGVAIDHEGNTIVLSQPQRFYVRAEEKGMARVVIRYSEITPEVTAKPGTGRAEPVYITEAYRIEEQRQRPTEPYIELARVNIGDESKSIRDAVDLYQPRHNEIDTRHRTISGAKPGGEISIGLLSYPVGKATAGWDSHQQGVLNLVQSIQQSTAYAARLVDAVELNSEIVDCELLCMAGYGEFQLSEAERKMLNNYFKRGGILFAEACPGPGGEHQDQLKGFRTSFANLCDQLGRPLRTMEREHPVFHSCYAFGSAPPGRDGNAMVMGDESMIFSDADYGCVWEGGRKGQTLSRQVIRDALEFGTNIAVYSRHRARLQAIRIMGS